MSQLSDGCEFGEVLAEEREVVGLFEVVEAVVDVVRLLAVEDHPQVLLEVCEGVIEHRLRGQGRVVAGGLR